jgi:hypothetical protein
MRTRIKHGTAQPSPQIHKIPAASRCWLKATLAERAMPGIAAIPGCITITLYHDAFVKIAMDMASISISNSVTSSAKS